MRSIETQTMEDCYSERNRLINEKKTTEKRALLQLEEWNLTHGQEGMRQT